MSERRVDFDSPWKETLEYYFEDFMAFFFSQAYADIDWQRGYEFLIKSSNKWCAMRSLDGALPTS